MPKSILLLLVVHTIKMVCRRPLEAHVLAALDRAGFYEDEQWKVTSEFTSSRSGDPKRKLKFCYKPNGKILHGRGQGGQLEYIAADLPGLVHGNSGQIIVSQAELDEAIRIAIQRFDTVAIRGQSWTDTHELHVCLNLPINPDHVLPLLRDTRILGLHGFPEAFDESQRGTSSRRTSIQTLQWSGKEVRASFYNKTRKICKDARIKYSDENACLRTEIRYLGKKRVAKFLGVRAGGAVAHLDFFGIYRALRHDLMKLPSGTVQYSKCTLKALLAHCLAQNVAWNGGDVMEWYRQSVDDKTFARTSREVSKLAMGMIKFAWQDILPPECPPEQVHVTSEGTTARAFHPSWGRRRRIVCAGGCYSLQEVTS